MSDTVKLTAIKVVSTEYVPDSVFISQAEFSVLRDDLIDRLLFRLHSYVMAEDHERAEHTFVAEYPATWWEHVKQRFAPRWFLSRYPIRMERVTKRCEFVARTYYPSLSAKYFPGAQVTRVRIDKELTP